MQVAAGGRDLRVRRHDGACAAFRRIKVERSKDDTGSRLGRGSIGQADPRVPVAIVAAKIVRFRKGVS